MKKYFLFLMLGCLHLNGMEMLSATAQLDIERVRTLLYSDAWKRMGKGLQHSYLEDGLADVLSRITMFFLSSYRFEQKRYIHSEDKEYNKMILAQMEKAYLILEILFDAGADPNCNMGDMRTPLDEAYVSFDDGVDFINTINQRLHEFLISRGAKKRLQGVFK